MPERLAVHLNRDHPRDVDPEAAALETDRSFVLEFVNHGGPVHVHLHLDDALAAVADPAATQVYVESEERRGVEITVPPSHPPAKGFVELSSGYGKEKARVNVTLTDERKDGGPDVAVDESLGEKSVSVEQSASSSIAEAVVPVVAATVLVVLAAAVAVTVSESLAPVLGVLALLAAVGVAAYLLAV
ncbi:DUF7524 family protein [Halobacterium bonnevillei]|uniref:Uncharacterized protein n=1 Tax=Halobacterium bonnevillei TaxID=2692200 RepID=A0A6B0SIZ4_9EURY|nr:hypothetical protein [Halobacterium bonnevillei]MXR21625.1 hypothetical protein [Halobacterium bonnevillei]